MKIKLIISFIVGAAITASLMLYAVARMLSAERAELYRGAETVKVIVAFTDLPSGTVLTKETVGMKSVFKSSLGRYELTPSEFEKIKDKQLKYPVNKSDPILSLYVEENDGPSIASAPDPSIKKVYIDDDLGIQIVIPDNWKPISAADAGQAGIVWEEGKAPPINELSLGYFDPDTGEKTGIFILSILGGTERSFEDLGEMEGFETIIWKSRTCYFEKREFQEDTIWECYVVAQKDSVISFMLGTSKSHADSITNILNEINF